MTPPLMLTKGAYIGLNSLLSGENNLFKIMAQNEVKLSSLDYNHFLILKDINISLAIKFCRYLGSIFKKINNFLFLFLKKLFKFFKNKMYYLSELRKKLNY